MTPLPETVPEAKATCTTRNTEVVDDTEILTVGIAVMNV